MRNERADAALGCARKDDADNSWQSLAGLKVSPRVRIAVSQTSETVALHDGEIFAARILIHVLF